MSFDWKQLLDQRGIPYIPNGRHDIDIGCPWCDPGNPQHYILTVSLRGRGWHCWKDRSHRGIRNARLIAALLHIGLAEARSLAGERYQIRDDLGSEVERLLAGASPDGVSRFRPLELPPEFRPFRAEPAAAPFIRYLTLRGFKRADILRFTENYGMYYARDGKQRYRVVFTLWLDGQLRAWSGRSIAYESDIRYLTSSPAKDGGDSVGNNLLWFNDLMRGGERLLLVEGPFDALKLRVLGQPSTCFFTARPSRAQIELLHDLLPRYRSTILLLDRGTLPTAISVRNQLAGARVQIATLPPHLKDPAEISALSDLRL